MPEMPSIKVAVSGTGYFSRFHYRAWKRIPEIEIVAICNRSRDRAQEFAAEFGVSTVFTDFGEMLEQAKPDLVDIVTPPETHLAAIALAANAKINVICQKPFCASLEEAKRAVALADTTNIRIAVHENFRFQPWYPEIKALLDAGEFGEIYQATFNLRPGDGQGERAYLDRQPYFQQMERFLIHETGIHLIDVFRFLFGDVGSVYASLRKLNRSIKGEDTGLAILDMHSGVRCVFDGNRLADHTAENRRLTMGTLLIEGAAGTIRLDGDGRIWLRNFNSNAQREHIYAWQNEDFGGDCVYRFQRHVVDHLLNQRPLQNTANEYLKNLLVEEAVYASNQKGCRLSL